MTRTGTYKLTDDFRESEHTAPLRAGTIVRDINFTPDDRRLPDIGICRIFTSREDAEIILAALIASQGV